MSLSHGPESNDENPQAELEEFKGNPDAPFAVVDKEQEAPGYSSNFEHYVEDAWEEVCQMMEWTDGEESLDFRNFKVAENPREVVSRIQETIVERGGDLPRYGVDGLFGPETTRAVMGLMNPERVAELEPTAAITPAESAQLDEMIYQPVLDEELKADVEQAGRVLESVFGNVEAAEGNLLPVFEDMPETFEETQLEDLIDARTKIIALKEDMLTSEPRLGPINEHMNKIIGAVEAELQSIDLSQIQSMDDILDIAISLEERLSSTMGEQLDEAEFDFMQMLDPQNPEAVDPEVFLTFVLSTIMDLGLGVLISTYDQKEEYKRIAGIFTQDVESFVKGMDVPLEDNPIVIDANEPVEETDDEGKEVPGRHTEGLWNFDLNGREVSFNLDEKTIQVDGKLATIEMPNRAELQHIQQNPDGSVSLSVEWKRREIERTFSQLEFMGLLDQIANTEVGEKIELSYGFYIRVDEDDQLS